MPKAHSDNLFNNLGSIIAYLAPFLQLFLFQILDTNTKLILFHENFLLISIVTAIISYLVISVLRSFPYTRINLTPWRNRAYNTFLDRTDPRMVHAEVAQAYIMQNKQPARPWYFENNNAHRFTIPASIAFFGFFLWIGLVNGEAEAVSQGWQLAQALLYLFFVVVVIFQIALHYVGHSVRKERLVMQQERFNKIVGLLIENNALHNLPIVRFVMQEESNEIGNRHLLTVIEVDGSYYQIFSDVEANYLIRVIYRKDLSAFAEGSGMETSNEQN